MKAAHCSQSITRIWREWIVQRTVPRCARMLGTSVAQLSRNPAMLGSHELSMGGGGYMMQGL
jgi:hypothetical protein